MLIFAFLWQTNSLRRWFSCIYITLNIENKKFLYNFRSKLRTKYNLMFKYIWAYFNSPTNKLQISNKPNTHVVAAKDGVAMNVDDKFLEVERRGSTNDEDLRSVYCCSAFMCLVFLVFLCCAVFFAFCWFFARYRLWALYHQRPCGLKVICAFNCKYIIYLIMINYDKAAIDFNSMDVYRITFGNSSSLLFIEF